MKTALQGAFHTENGSGGRASHVRCDLGERVDGVLPLAGAVVAEGERRGDEVREAGVGVFAQAGADGGNVAEHRDVGGASGRAEPDDALVTGDVVVHAERTDG